MHVKSVTRFIGQPFVAAVWFVFLHSIVNGLAREQNPAPPKLEISGYGFFGNRELKQLIQLLEVSNKEREVYDAQFIEDAVLIVMSRINRDGFLKPNIKVEVILDDGTEGTYLWDEPLEAPLARPLRARKVHFVIDEGLRYQYDKIVIVGLQSLTEKEARGFFIEAGALLPLRTTRTYTPQNLERGVASLTEVLERNGFENAKVTVSELQTNDDTGKVAVTITVEEGPKAIVRNVRQQLFLGASSEPTTLDTIQTNHVYSKLWVQDFAQVLRTTYYHRGYPDANVEVTTERREQGGQTNYLDLLATIRTNPQIVVGTIAFEGQEKTRTSVLHRRVPLSDGELLNRVGVEQGRVRLARLGVFESVELDYEPVDEHTRNVIYRLKEGKELDLSLLFGYGSYELLRGGIELEQLNVFGRAHNSRLKLVQSFRSTSADYQYTMPELLGEDIDVFLNASGLRRKEISFVREEFGGGAGA